MCEPPSRVVYQIKTDLEFTDQLRYFDELEKKIKLKFTGISELDFSFQLTLSWCELKFMASSQRDKNPSIGRKEY